MSVNFTNIRDGIGLQGLSGAPASPANGDIYYDTTLTSFRFYQAGAWVSLPVISGATITTPTAGSTFGNVTANGGMTGIRNTAIGVLAGDSMTTGNNNVVMGYNAGTAIADGVQNVYIGSNAATSSTSGGDNVVIGNSANIGASTISSVIIGASAGASTTGNRLLVLGAGAGVSSGVQQSMAFGYTAVATTDNQAVMGSLNAPVLDFVVGAGDTDSSTGAAVTIRTTNRTGTNTSATGANITIAGSRGTGTGTGGSLILSTAPAGSSGPSLNALVTRLSISDAGAINIPGFTASRVLVSDASKNLISSSVTSTELGYVSGVTSAIQTQLDAKVAKSTATAKGDIFVATASATVTNQAIGTNGQVLMADSAQTNGLKWANAPQGLKNYITVNADLEQGSTTGYSLGTVTLDGTTKFPSGVPTFGSGASGNLSLSSVSSGQLAGSYSLGYVSSAATTAGNFVATNAFAVDLEGQAKPMQIRVAYKAVTNPANGNYSGTSANSFGIAIYDVTNSTWIQPAGVFNIIQNSGVGIMTGTFQTSADGTSYRLVFYNANATSGATTIYLDDFFVGPQITAAGAAMSDCTPPQTTVLKGATNGSTYTNQTTTMSWARSGDRMKGTVYTTFTGTPATGTGAFIWSLPAGYSIDSAKLATTSSNAPSLGAAKILDSGTQFYTGTVVYNSAQGGGLSIAPQGNASTEASPTVPMTVASGDFISLEFEVPIVGWSAQTVMSNDTDTRVVAASYFVVSTAVIANNAGLALIPLTTKIVDTHNAVSGNQFRAPVSGVYKISCTGGTDTSTDTGYVTIAARKNAAVIGSGGSVLQSSTTAATTPSIAVIVEAVAGDLLDVAASYAQGSNRNFSATVSFERLSGPATVAATDSVYAFYNSAAGQSIANAATAIVDFGTKVSDSHGAVTTGGSWKFTAPVSGTYQVGSNVRFANGLAWTQGGYAASALFKNGSTFTSSDTAIQTTATLSTGPGNSISAAIVKLNAGDTIDIRASHGESAARALVASAGLVWVAINRIGN